jgi:hypothetical protein
MQSNVSVKVFEQCDETSDELLPGLPWLEWVTQELYSSGDKRYSVGEIHNGK